MILYGYETEQTDNLLLPDNLAVDPPSVPVPQLADWITDYYGDETASERLAAISGEIMRQRLFTCDPSLTDQLENGIHLYVLSRAVFSEAQESVNGSRPVNDT